MLSNREIAHRLRVAILTERKPDLNEYREPKDGERVLGIMVDPNLLANAAVMDDLWAEFCQKWAGQLPQSPAEFTAMFRDGRQLERFDQTFHVMICGMMGIGQGQRELPSIQLRKGGGGNVLVVETKPRRTNVRIVLRVPAGGCDDPDCVACNLARKFGELGLF
jgi:hypothetical protein